MPYADQPMDIDTPAGPIRVIVTGEALTALAGGPASPAEVVTQMNRHQHLFARIATAKHAGGKGGRSGVVHVTADDVDLN